MHTDSFLKQELRLCLRASSSCAGRIDTQTKGAQAVLQRRVPWEHPSVNDPRMLVEKPPACPASGQSFSGLKEQAASSHTMQQLPPLHLTSPCLYNSTSTSQNHLPRRLLALKSPKSTSRESKLKQWRKGIKSRN